MPAVTLPVIQSLLGNYVAKARNKIILAGILPIFEWQTFLPKVVTETVLNYRTDNVKVVFVVKQKIGAKTRHEANSAKRLMSLHFRILFPVSFVTSAYLCDIGKLPRLVLTCVLTESLSLRKKLITSMVDACGLEPQTPCV